MIKLIIHITQTGGLIGKGIRGAAEEIWMMTILDSKNRPLNIHIEYSVNEHGTKALLVYCQVIF